MYIQSSKALKVDRWRRCGYAWNLWFIFLWVKQGRVIWSRKSVIMRVWFKRWRTSDKEWNAVPDLRRLDRGRFTADANNTIIVRGMINRCWCSEQIAMQRTRTCGPDFILEFLPSSHRVLCSSVLRGRTTIIKPCLCTLPILPVFTRTLMSETNQCWSAPFCECLSHWCYYVIPVLFGGNLLSFSGEKSQKSI